jgi:predicted nuclease of predicted toxin-antitoxin system
MELGATEPRISVWVDAQLPPALATWLSSEFDVDAVHIQDRGLLTSRDEEIFLTARRSAAGLGHLVLITKDEDFARLVHKHGPPPQILWLTAGNMRNADLRRLILRAWPRLLDLLLGGEPLVEVGREH